MSIRTIILATTAALAPLSAMAQLLDMPNGATRTGEKQEQLSSYRLPIGPWQNDQIQTIWAEGEVTQEAWQIKGEGLTTLQILTPMRQQLEDDGYDILFQCDAETCGGFDFRYATDVLPEPEMHVDLGDFRFLSAQRMGPDQPEYISLMVSRSALRGFVQVIRVGSPLGDATTLNGASSKSPDAMAAAPALATPLGTSLEKKGRAVLADLSFSTGSAQLEGGEYPSLDALATYLLANPDRTVMLVGHTDAEGTLDGNIALSRKRAQTVMRRLIDVFAVPASQIKAQGVGYLAPLTSNLTDDGRTKNRRVEVILTSTQ